LQVAEVARLQGALAAERAACRQARQELAAHEASRGGVAGQQRETERGARASSPSPSPSSLSDAEKLKALFELFDSDGDGLLSQKDTDAWGFATKGEAMDAEDWAGACEHLGADPALGLSLFDLHSMYEIGAGGEQDAMAAVRHDFAALCGGAAGPSLLIGSGGAAATGVAALAAAGAAAARRCEELQAQLAQAARRRPGKHGGGGAEAARRREEGLQAAAAAAAQAAASAEEAREAAEAGAAAARAEAAQLREELAAARLRGGGGGGDISGGHGTGGAGAAALRRELEDARTELGARVGQLEASERRSAALAEEQGVLQEQLELAQSQIGKLDERNAELQELAHAEGASAALATTQERAEGGGSSSQGSRGAASAWCATASCPLSFASVRLVVARRHDACVP
jgi:hypothetical protein